jgi:phospholipid/cholesterol/gamma-HCH transport system substrate-binding protein
MARANIEVKVGLTVVLAAVILIAGLLWIKGYRFGHRFYTTQIIFSDIGTLEKGDPVLVTGVNRGKVKAVELYHGQVLVTVNLSDDVVLKTDAEFAVKNIGLMGERFVEVRPGHADSLFDLSTPAIGYYDTGIPEVMGVLGRMVSETHDLVQAIRATLGSDGTLSGVAETIENTRQFTGELKETVAENRESIGQAARDISATARTMRDFVAANQGQIEQAVNRFDTASVALTRFTNRLDTLAGGMQTLLDRIANGEGTLGLMLADDDLYNELKTAAQDLDVLITDIRANPKKYVQVQFKLF